MKKKSFPLLMIIFTLIFNWSCKKDGTKDTDTIYASDNVKSFNLFTDSKSLIDEAGYKTGSFNGILNDTNVVVTFDSINHSDVDTITINFGSGNRTSADGRMRKGKIITVFTGKYNDTAKLHTITYNGYNVDNYMLTGNIKEYYKGYNATGHKYYKDTIQGMVYTSTGTTISLNSVSDFAYTAGDSTDIWSDNKLSITGIGSGVTSEGKGYTFYISSPFIRNFATGCRRYLVAGTVQLAYNNAYRSADLGSGACDDLISVAIDGEVYQVSAN